MTGWRLRLPFEAGHGEPFGRLDWCLFAGVLLLAALLRLPALGSVPPGLWRDEAGYALAAQEVQRGILRVYWGDKEPLFPYVLAAVFSLFGPSVEALRGTAALFGVGTVGLTHLLGRLLLGRWGGLVAAVALASSFWTVDLNRIGFRVNTMPFFVTLGFWLLWRGLAGGSRWNWLAAGVAIGLTPYTYLAARMAPIVVLLFFLGLLATDRRRVTANSAGWTALAGGMVAAVMPLVVFFAFNPSSFFDRAEQLSPFRSAASIGDMASIALVGVRDTVGMFFWRGDSEPRHNIPGRPVLDVATAALFVVGVAAAVMRLRERVALFLLLWLAVLLLPSALAVDNPHALRTLGAAPSVYLLVAVGASVVGVAIGGRSRRPAVAPLLATAWLAMAAAANGRDYFVTWATDPRTAQFFEAEVAAAARLLRDAPAEALTYVSAPFVPHPTVEFLAPDRSPIWLDGAEGVVFPPVSGSHGAVYALPGSNVRAVAALRAAFPAATVTGGPVGHDGRPLASLVSVPPNFAALLPRLTRPVRFSADGLVDVTGVSELPTALEAGGRLEVAVAWSPRGRTDRPDLAFFVHLLDARGRLRGQHDGVAYPSGQWRGGEQAVSWFPLSVANDAPPGRYRVVLGIYPRSTLRRLPWAVAEADGDRPLGDTVELGVTKIAPPPPPAPERRLSVEFGGQLALEGIDIGRNGCVVEAARPPCNLAIGLHWRALSGEREDYQVFLHLAGPDGRPLVQHDGAPLDGDYPTSIWSLGERILDRRVLSLPDGFPSGEYRIVTGLYRLPDGSRLPTSSGGESVELAFLRVRS